jgi:hypothetical protein
MSPKHFFLSNQAFISFSMIGTVGCRLQGPRSEGKFSGLQMVIKFIVIRFDKNGMIYISLTATIYNYNWRGFMASVMSKKSMKLISERTLIRTL